MINVTFFPISKAINGQANQRVTLQTEYVFSGFQFPMTGLTGRSIFEMKTNTKTSVNEILR
jgi:hypothetical protein